jgi:hypothetical protein
VLGHCGSNPRIEKFGQFQRVGGEEMSRIYSKLREMEAEKQANVNIKPLLNMLEKAMRSPEDKAVPTAPQTRTECVPHSPDTGERNFSEEANVHSLLPALGQFADHMKNTLGSIKAFTELSRGRFSDVEFGNTFQQRVTEEIDKTYLELDCLLDYVRIKSSVREADVLRSLLEELLQRHGKRLRDKDLRIVRKQYETDLSEPGVEDEQLRYILNWVFQYVILSAAPGGNLGVLTRSCPIRRETGSHSEPWIPEGERDIEMIIVFTHLQSPGSPSEKEPEPRVCVEEKTEGFFFPLVQEIIRENRGSITFRVYQEKHVTQVSLRLPAASKKVIHSN